MATHFICQATEPIPHRFPTSRVQEKGHGAVSQYELLNLSDKAHCQFPPPGWDTSESSEDSLPLYRVPAPSWKISTNLVGPDPELCVTPEKSLASKIISQQNRHSKAPLPTKNTECASVDPDLDLTLTPEKVFEAQTKSNLKNGIHDDGKFKGQHRVRFELDTSKESSEGEGSSFLFPRSGPTRPYKPTSYSDEGSSDLVKELVKESKHKAVQYTVNTVNSRTVYVPLKDQTKGHNLANHFDEERTHNDETVSKSNIADVSEIDYNTNSNSGPVCHIQNHKTQGIKEKSKSVRKEAIGSDTQNYIKSQGDSAPKRKVKVKRETSEMPTKTQYDYPFSEGVSDTSEYEHVFNRPEYNSTLRMRTELQQIKESQIDVAKALEKRLQLSDTKKTEIIEKATSKVNPKESMFNGLVSLEIPIDDLRNQVEQTKTSRVSSKSSRPSTQTAKQTNEPDLMEFFTSDLQREQAEFSLPGLQVPSESLSTASQIRAFDLYRHNRVWDNNSYFSAKKK